MKKYLFYFAALGWGLSLIIHLSALAGIDVSENIPFIWLLHVGIFAVWLPVVLELRKEQDVQNGSFLSRMNPLAFYKNTFKGTPSVLIIIGVTGFIYAMINILLFMQSQTGVPTVKDGQYILHNHGQLIKTLTEAEYHQYKANEVQGFSGHWIAFYGMAMAVLFRFIKPVDKDEEKIKV